MKPAEKKCSQFPPGHKREDFIAVGAWVLRTDHAKLRDIAKSNNLTLSQYIRAIIVDALIEDSESLNNSENKSSNTQMDTSVA